MKIYVDHEPPNPNEDLIDLTIIVSTYNRNQVVINLLNELGSIKDECEVIVVDDGSLTPLRSFTPCSPSLRIIRHEKNMGTPKSWNDGIEAATRKTVLLLPDDIHPNFGLEQLQWLSEMAQDKIVGIKVIDKSGKMFNHRKLSKIIYWLSGQVFPSHDDKAGFTDFVLGTMAFPRDIPIRFDENFKGNAFREETDFQLRARRVGYKVFYMPSLSLTHDEIRMGGQSDKKESNLENHRYFLKKHFKTTWPLKWMGYMCYRSLRDALVG